MFINAYSEYNKIMGNRLVCSKLINSFLIELKNYNGICTETIFLSEYENKAEANKKAFELIKEYNLVKEK